MNMQTRIMAELERYAELSREKDLLNERWDEQHTLLVESHERVVQEITEEYEARIQVRPILTPHVAKRRLTRAHLLLHVAQST